MIQIKKIDDSKVKSEITAFILRKLPDWFGIEEGIVEYVEKSKETIYYAVYDCNNVVGFLSLKINNQYTSEIYAMGILESYHNKGIGKNLIQEAVNYSRENNYKFLMVKTLGESHPDKYYKRTREFYKRTGFYSLEEIKEIWGEECPCLVMIRSL